MGKRDRRQLRSRLQVLIMHLLKWQFQPDKQSQSWLATIDHQRDQIEALLLDSPSLRSDLEMVFQLMGTKVNKNITPYKGIFIPQPSP